MCAYVSYVIQVVQLLFDRYYGDGAKHFCFETIQPLQHVRWNLGHDRCNGSVDDTKERGASNMVQRLVLVFQRSLVRTSDGRRFNLTQVCRGFLSFQVKRRNDTSIRLRPSHSKSCPILHETFTASSNWFQLVINIYINKQHVSAG
jgi:hypothetical protein